MPIDLRDALSSGRSPHQAIQHAIDRVASQGGGTVSIPPGVWECGTLHLRSRVHLHLETGATLRMSKNPDDFPVIVPHLPKPPGRIQAMLWAEGCEDIAISGFGVMDGGRGDPLSYEESLGLSFRPAIALFRGCRRVAIRDCQIRDADFWTLHLQRCEDVRIHGIHIQNCRARINTDGIDPDGCRRMTISDCLIEAGDDAIVVKSTEGDPCEDIVVSNCILSSACAALKIGTESLGTIRRVVMTNCVIRDSSRALCLYMKDGGVYEDIAFTNITAEASAPFPIIVDATPRRGDGRPSGTIRRITFDNIRVVGSGRIYLEGAEDAPLRQISLRHIAFAISTPQDFRSIEKDRGAGGCWIDPKSLPHAKAPYHVVAARVKGLDLEGLTVDAPGDRGLLYAWHVRDAHIRRSYLTQSLDPRILAIESTIEEEDREG